MLKCFITFTPYKSKDVIEAKSLSYQVLVIVRRALWQIAAYAFT
jgi:hypothetical protein